MIINYKICHLTQPSTFAIRTNQSATKNCKKSLSVIRPTLPLMAALGLPSHIINWFFVTNFNSMTKRLITKDSANYENKYLWSNPKPAGNILYIP